MRYIYIKIIFFFFVFYIIIRTVGNFDNLDRSSSTNINLAKLNCETEFDSLDILFVGNSYCYSGINPAYFDSIHVKTFNLGIATAGINYYSILIPDYLASVNQKPKAIFILLSPMTFCSRSDDAVNYPIYRYLNSPLSHEEYILKYQPSKLTFYPKILIKSFLKIFTALPSIGNKKNFMHDSIRKDKGFVRSNVKTSPANEKVARYLYTDLMKDNFDSIKAEKIISLGESIMKKNIEVVFFTLPANKLNTFYSGSYMKDYSEFLIKIKSKFSFIDNDIKLASEYYRDIDHLNTQGAKIVTLHMINKIRIDKTLQKILNF